MKTCRGCGEAQPPENFPIHTGTRRRPRCHDCHAAYMKDVRTRWYSRHGHRKREASRRWRAENPHKKRAECAAYRANKRRRSATLTQEMRREITQLYARARELTRVSGEPHHVDHIIPLHHPLVCGLHVPHNLQVIPRRLNMKKRNTISLDLLTCSHLFYRHANET